MSHVKKKKKSRSDSENFKILALAFLLYLWNFSLHLNSNQWIKRCFCCCKPEITCLFSLRYRVPHLDCRTWNDIIPRPTSQREWTAPWRPWLCVLMGASISSGINTFLRSDSPLTLQSRNVCFSCRAESRTFSQLAPGRLNGNSPIKVQQVGSVNYQVVLEDSAEDCPHFSWNLFTHPRPTGKGAPVCSWDFSGEPVEEDSLGFSNRPVLLPVVDG